MRQDHESEAGLYYICRRRIPWVINDEDGKFAAPIPGESHRTAARGEYFEHRLRRVESEDELWGFLLTWASAPHQWK